MRRLIFSTALLASCYMCLDKQYRSERINYIYEKALQHLEDRKRLQKLEGELNKYDKMYMTVKEEYHDKFGELGKELSKIDKKLFTMLEGFDLHSAIKAFNEKMKHKYDPTANLEDRFDVTSARFSDERLMKLWNSAQDNKFSKSELEELYNELKEAEQMLAHHDDAVQSLNKVPHENDIHHDDVASVQEKHKVVKISHKRLSDHLDRLHQKVHEGLNSDIAFENEKVRKMWKLAQVNRNFTEHELNVLKDELLHFDKQLKKIEYHRAELNSIKNKRDNKDLSDLHHFDDIELEAKHERMDRKIKKLEKYLRSKVTHSEL